MGGKAVKIAPDTNVLIRVIAHEGLRMGAERFVSFDRQAVTQLRAQGVDAALL